MLALAPEMVWIQPGDLARLLAQLGIEPTAASPLHEYPELLTGEASPPSAEHLEDRTVLTDARAYAEHIQALAQPVAVLRVRRGRHRQPPDTFYACTADRFWRTTTVLSPNADGSAMLLFPPDRTALLEWLLEGLGSIRPAEVPLTALPPLRPVGLAIVLALAGLFRARYPDPDPAWAPDAPLAFGLDEVQAQLQDGLTGADRHSLLVAYMDLVQERLPHVGPEALEGVLYVLANEQLVELEESDTTLVGIVLGERLTWALRCLAWWDLTLAVEPWPRDWHPTVEPIYAIQASAVWRFDAGPDATLPPRMTSGFELADDLQAFLDAAAGVLDASGDVIAPAVPPAPDQEYEERPTALYQPDVETARCAACGEELGPTGHFCGHCGAPYEATTTAHSTLRADRGQARSTEARLRER